MGWTYCLHEGQENNDDHPGKQSKRGRPNLRWINGVEHDLRKSDVQNG